MMHVFPTMMFGLAAAASLAACSKSGSIDEDAADFRPPTAQPRDDYARALDTRFGRIDRNSDGAIQTDEMQRRRGGGTASDSGTGGAGASAGGGGNRAANRAANLRALDADGDGEVTRREFVNGSLARFDKADANHDNILTSDERTASGLFVRGGGGAASAN